MDQDRGIRDPKYVEYVPNTCQIRGPEYPNTWNTCQNAAIRANTCPTYANTCEYVTSEVTYSTSEYVGHVSSGCLRRRLRAAGVFLSDSADRRAALPEWE